jgi:predicted O-linked N-acetylglucosamine transferase (SPINDLY family)
LVTLTPAARRQHRRDASDLSSFQGRLSAGPALLRDDVEDHEMGEKKRRQATVWGDRGRQPVSTTSQLEIAKSLKLFHGGLLNEAITILSEILNNSPNHLAASYISGDIEFQRKNYEKARIHYERALASDSSSIPLKINLGAVLYKLGFHVEAIKNYDYVLRLQPDNADALFSRALSLLELYEFEAARVGFDRVIALTPDFEVAHVVRCMAELEVIYDTQKDITERRKVYEGQLRRLCQRPNAFKGGIGVSQPFYLAYQGENDRDLQALYGAAVCKQARLQYPAALLAAPPTLGEPVRVGIVSGFFRNHANWRVPIRGWLSQFNREQFQLFGYYVGVLEDEITAEAERLCGNFTKGERSLDQWRSQILSDKLHAIIYPEIGMDPTIPNLAAQRLAPIQCSSWGHPQTSGFPTIDYFLSSELMEPGNGKDHYTEELVLLPNLSVYIEPVEIPAQPLRREEIGIRDDTVAFWCGQSLYKFLPKYDDVFAKLATVLGKCQFIFVSHRSPDITNRFQRRLDTAFAAVDLASRDYCMFLPDLPQGKFIAATGLCDVYLDSIGWSGCNTSLEAIAYDMPIVTLPLELMRTRHSSAFLEIMSVRETIADSPTNFVSIAVRLAKDPGFRLDISNRIKANKYKIFRDAGAVAGLEQFLARSVSLCVPTVGRTQ